MPDPAEIARDPSATADPPVPEAQTRPAPSGRRDWRALLLADWRLTVAAVTLIVGIVLVILGWYGTAYTNIITEQIPYLISGGLLGLGLIILAGVLAASGAQKRDNDELRRDLTRAIRALEFASGQPVDERLARTPVSANGHLVFVLPGGRSFHEAGCPIIEGKPTVDEMPQGEAITEGYAACKLCDVSG